MKPKQSSQVKTLLNENEKSWALAALFVFLVLLVLYASFWFWSPIEETQKLIRDLALVFTGNISPVPLLFVLGYILLRPIREIKANVEGEDLSESTAMAVQTRIAADFYPRVLKPDLTEINSQIAILTKVAGLPSQQENVEILQHLRSDLIDLQAISTKRILELGDTVRDRFHQLEDSFQGLESNLRKGILLDIREYIRKELESLDIHLDATQISDLAEKLAVKVEKSFAENERNRTKLFQQDIATGLLTIQRKVNETLVSIEGKQDSLSQDIQEKIDDHQELVIFATELRSDRNELLHILWKNIEDEFAGEIEKGMPSPKDMLRERLRKNNFDDKQANELAKQLSTIFITYLQNALGKMQTIRLESAPNIDNKINQV